MSACDHNWREHPCRHGRRRDFCQRCHEEDLQAEQTDWLRAENARLHARVRELEDEVAVWQHEYDERK